MNQRIKNILISFDQLLLTLATLGASSPDETISAAAYRWEQQKKPYGNPLRVTIDFVASPFEKNHCFLSYVSEVNRSQLNDYYRSVTP